MSLELVTIGRDISTTETAHESVQLITEEWIYCLLPLC